MEKTSFAASLFKKFFQLIQFKKRFSLEFLEKNGKKQSNMRPPSHFQKTVDCKASTLLGQTIWTIQHKNTAPKIHILFFHGGAYVQTFTYFHWDLIKFFVQELNCAVHAPNYPLAPEHQVNQAVEFSLELYKKILAENQIDTLVLMGDSAGGGLSLVLAQQLEIHKIQQPNQIILISPWVDVSMQNSEIKNVDPFDPILSIRGLLEAGKSYAGELELMNPIVSPLFGSLDNLPPISIFAGTHDILYPDALKLFEKLQEVNNLGILHTAESMLHDWVLYPLKESSECRKAILDYLNSKI